MNLFFFKELNGNLSRYVEAISKKLEQQIGVFSNFDPLDKFSSTMEEPPFEEQLSKFITEKIVFTEPVQPSLIYTGMEALYSKTLPFNGSVLITPDVYSKLISWTGLPHLDLKTLYHTDPYGLKKEELTKIQFNIPDILILIKSNRGRVFGIYTGNGCEVPDSRGSDSNSNQLMNSFAFSITKKKMIRFKSKITSSNPSKFCTVSISDKASDSNCIVSISLDSAKNNSAIAVLNEWCECKEEELYPDNFETFLAGSKKFAISQIEIFEVCGHS